MRHLPERECAVVAAAFESALLEAGGRDGSDGTSGTSADEPPPKKGLQGRAWGARPFASAKGDKRSCIGVVEQEVAVGRQIQHHRA